MRIALTLLIALHGVIHLFGFLKAFGISSISAFHAISQPISKAFGILWLFTFVLFASTTVLLVVQSNYWGLTGIFGVILSQVLIINYWGDAKFGTILNMIILVAISVASSTLGFKNQITEERIRLFENSQSISNRIARRGATAPIGI